MKRCLKNSGTSESASSSESESEDWWKLERSSSSEGSERSTAAILAARSASVDFCMELMFIFLTNSESVDLFTGGMVFAEIDGYNVPRETGFGCRGSMFIEEDMWLK
ncbi:hypothetical protein OGAPHI_002127 [Ogataea philodendri]|uniref:Uncharacterized protein n=1 Tax=Ogataea philodendri TaxID=1378263 RepID=A0A9P8T6Q9_9ASCO|nr:uncharacterized protein OGAPHI_002127 [Ogataea philodendri]KAH3668373.1 hypothetical protein OGAPHI_002127 [Ogataea philodendri]